MFEWGGGNIKVNLIQVDQRFVLFRPDSLIEFESRWTTWVSKILEEVDDCAMIWKPLPLLTLADNNQKTNFCLFYKLKLCLILWHFDTASFTYQGNMCYPFWLECHSFQKFLANFSRFSSGLLLRRDDWGNQTGSISSLTPCI